MMECCLLHAVSHSIVLCCVAELMNCYVAVAGIEEATLFDLWNQSEGELHITRILYYIMPSTYILRSRFFPHTHMHMSLVPSL